MSSTDPASAPSGVGGDQHARVRDAAAARGLAIDIRERPPANSLFEAAELLGIPPSGIVKTLVVKRPSTGSGTQRVNPGSGTQRVNPGSGTQGVNPGSGTQGVNPGSGTQGEYLFALVPGGRAISWPKLRALVGVNKLRLPEPELALSATGYERGTIVPIGSTTDWPIYADESIRGQRIAMGAGVHGYSLFVDADDLIAAYGAIVADISVPEERRD